jgi:hypothetical protein
VNGFYPGILAVFDSLGLTGLGAYRVPILELCKISLVKGLFLFQRLQDIPFLICGS